MKNTLLRLAFKVYCLKTDRWEIAEWGDFALQALPTDLSPGCKRRMADYLAGHGPYLGQW